MELSEYQYLFLPRTKVQGYNINRSYGTPFQRAIGSADIVVIDFSPSIF